MRFELRNEKLENFQEDEEIDLEKKADKGKWWSPCDYDYRGDPGPGHQIQVN